MSSSGSVAWVGAAVALVFVLLRSLGSRIGREAKRPIPRRIAEQESRFVDAA